MVSFNRMTYIETENINIPFKIYLSCHILIKSNVWLCSSSNIIHRSINNMSQWGPQTKFPDFSLTLTLTTNKIPWLFPDFDTKMQNSLTCSRIPWLFPDSGKDWNFPDFSLTVATLFETPSRSLWRHCKDMEIAGDWTTFVWGHCDSVW